MRELRKAFIRHLTLQRFAPKTHQAYIGAVNDLAKHYRTSPDALTDVQIQDYFLHLIQDRKSAWSTCNTKFSGIKSFYQNVLGRDINAVIPPRPRQKQLPHILSKKDVWALINSCRQTSYDHSC